MIVSRLATSTYYTAAFLQHEAECIQNLNLDLKYEFGNPDADIIITNTHVKLTAHSPNTKLYIHPNSGFDHFSYQWVKNAPPIVLGNELRSDAVVQYILSALLEKRASIPQHARWEKSRQFSRKLLSDESICLIGMGQVGKKLFSILSACGAKISVFDPKFPCKDDMTTGYSTYILACGLTKENRHFIDDKILKAAFENFLLINCARGELISYPDLWKALEEKKGSAVLDVFLKEPCDFSQFIPPHVNVRATSHIAGVYPQLESRTLEFIGQTIRDFILLPHFTLAYQDKLLNQRAEWEFLT